MINPSIQTHLEGTTVIKKTLKEQAITTLKTSTKKDLEHLKQTQYKVAFKKLQDKTTNLFWDTRTTPEFALFNDNALYNEKNKEKIKNYLNALNDVISIENWLNINEYYGIDNNLDYPSRTLKAKTSERIKTIISKNAIKHYNAKSYMKGWSILAWKNSTEFTISTDPLYFETKQQITLTLNGKKNNRILMNRKYFWCNGDILNERKERRTDNNNKIDWDTKELIINMKYFISLNILWVFTSPQLLLIPTENHIWDMLWKSSKPMPSPDYTKW